MIQAKQHAYFRKSRRIHTALMPDRALLVDQLPLASSLKRRSGPDEGIQHVTLAIGYYNSAPSTLS
jgi:hypothetical protein